MSSVSLDDFEFPYTATVDKKINFGLIFCLDAKSHMNCVVKTFLWKSSFGSKPITLPAQWIIRLKLILENFFKFFGLIWPFIFFLKFIFLFVNYYA